jgi:tetratricopeptide (TPR) repeat protein
LGVHRRKKGRFADAEAEDRRAIALSYQRDPSYWCELAFLYWTYGHLDKMGGLMKELLVAHPNYGFTRFLNARLLKEQGRFDEAVAELQISQTLQFSVVTLMVERASIDAYRGNRQSASAILDKLTELSKTQPVDSLLIAGVYARLGDVDVAFKWLDGGYADRDSTLLSLATSPVLAGLRGDDRFARLLQRLHFAP